MYELKTRKDDRPSKRSKMCELTLKILAITYLSGRQIQTKFNVIQIFTRVHFRIEISVSSPRLIDNFNIRCKSLLAQPSKLSKSIFLISVSWVIFLSFLIFLVILQIRDYFSSSGLTTSGSGYDASSTESNRVSFPNLVQIPKCKRKVPTSYS